jgi:hypothetical protein
MSTCNLYLQVDDEKTWKKTKVGMIDCNYWPQYLPGGDVQWLLPKYWTPSIKQCARYCTDALPRPSKCPSKLVHFFCNCFVCCCPGGHWGNTEQVVVRWQRPVASGVALDMLHWSMPSVLLQRTAMAIKKANNGGALIHHCHIFCIIIHSYKTCYSDPLKLTPSYNIDLIYLVSLFA